MSHVPIELYLIIFDILCTRDLIRCRQVCSLWDFIITNSMHIFDIDVSESHIKNKSLAIFHNASKINLTNCTSITNKGLRYLSNVPNINLNGCFNISNNGLKHIKNVKILDISWCNILDNDILLLNAPEKVSVSMEIGEDILSKFPSTVFDYDTCRFASRNDND